MATNMIDYVGTWGPAILGHAHPKIIAAVKAAAEHGTSFGIPNPLEVTMAKLICAAVPSVQKVRMTQFRHGGVHERHPAGARIHEARQDHQVRRLLPRPRGFAAGQGRVSGALTFGHPDSAGVPAAFTQHTIVLPFNDVEAVQAAFAANKDQIAGIIVEPVPGNAGLVSAASRAIWNFCAKSRRRTARC